MSHTEPVPGELTALFANTGWLPGELLLRTS